ncbi:MAG: type II secretion system protein M [Hydrogenophaga sp.]|uniref:type II secretion system protein GspM n=1 Tax=Hydrogenophaga sp. TaxID=1904254 RepID=UPI001D29B105|nr:type II secretion system protein GspM [Hydrogenophaga sp.]MBX3609732.1 type II secretion system protein M [Hydrogenophaga sp.]
MADTASPFSKSSPTRGLAAASAWLASLSPRERRLVLIAATVVGLGLLWMVAIAPAWHTLRAAPAQHAALDAQLARMQQMAQTAEALRAQSGTAPPSRDEALRALEAATVGLGGTGQISVLGERATLALRQTPPQALAAWLQQVRINARLLPVESQISRDAASGGWTGTLVVGGPPLAGN